MDSNNPGPTASGMKIVTRQYLFKKLQEQDLPSIQEKLDSLENHVLSLYEVTEGNKKIFKHKFSHFKTEIKQRWLKAHKTEKTFLKNNKSWLEGTFEIPIESPARQGRPCKSFDESSDRTKRRKTEELRSTTDENVILHAAQVTFQKSGRRDASKVLRDITNSPTRASKYRKACSQSDKVVAPLSPFEALQMFIEADLTKRQYLLIRATHPKHYPCYDLLLKAKQECYPPKTSLRVTATCAEIELQGLMNHTIYRLSEYLEEVLLTLNEIERQSLKILCKWGCDGSQQERYKQKFSEHVDSDANIFLSSMVPLQITCGEEGKKVIWQNPTPSSPRFCRPIRFRFVKESADVTKEEINYIQNGVKTLNPTIISLNGNKFIFTQVMKMTMVDGKVCNAATNTTSTSRCYICGATSKDFNDLTKKTEIKSEALEFGISVLHARIRLFESILHLAYKLPTKKYRARKTDEEKNIELKRKKEIHNRFRDETGLLVDVPKSNAGNTNDGNTSRRFFENTKLAADITGINHELIHRLKVILEAISSGKEIDAEKYNAYALQTARLYVKEYGWHPMTPTMHKVLIHGSSIIENALLPIGALSEEAAEARNKHFRSYRLNYARKFSREECNLDICLRLLLTSDPLVSSMRSAKKKAAHESFLKETIELLKPGLPNENESKQEEDVSHTKILKIIAMTV